jgi:hypothetical protein
MPLLWELDGASSLAVVVDRFSDRISLSYTAQMVFVILTHHIYDEDLL